MPEQSPVLPRDRMIAALEHRPIIGRVPHFELAFYLTMEAFGKVQPGQRHYSQWDQMSEDERRLHRSEIADLCIMTAERYEHDCIFITPNPGTLDETFRHIDLIRQRSGDRYMLVMHGDATYSIPNGDTMMEWSVRLAEKRQSLKDEADRNVDRMLERARLLREHGGLDGFALCSDYCFNSGPFLRPEVFAELITPYLKRLIAGERELGYYVIKHTDGNIMPIIDQLVDASPHALHSLDPQGHVDIAEVKRLYGQRVALIGNVNCGLLTTGTDEEVIASVRYALRSGMPGGGYIFSTSNCIFTGMPLRRYDLMLDVWRREGNYTAEDWPAGAGV